MRPLLTLLPCLLLAQTVEYYPFSIDQDSVRGPVDFSFLNQPLTPASKIFVRGSQFFAAGPDLLPNTADDEPVRFFGVNLAFGANFPSEADSPRIARRLRRLGVNLVRLHHLDTQPDANPNNAGSILTQGPYPTFNPAAVSRLRAFLTALREEGIYVNLNLKVGYQFRPAIDGVPALPQGSVFPDQSKPLHMIHPRMVELQEQFTREVFEQLALANDPVLAQVEINNESSLVYSYQTNQLDSRVLGDYREELSLKWNQYLEEKYKTTPALRAAWAAAEDPGPELLSGEWRTELHGSGRATLESLSEQETPVLKVNVAQGGTGNTVIIKQTGFSLNTARPYTATIEMRADVPSGQTRSVYFDVKEDVSPWRTISAQTVQVGSEWRRYVMTFTPAIVANNNGRFAVQVEQFAGSAVFLRKWSLSQPARDGLDPEESLEAGDVDIVLLSSNPTEPKLNDYLSFLAARDKSYLDRMLAAVRSKTDAPAAGTQMDFGGLLNLDSHSALDYQDRHYYVDHYGFPNRAWDGYDWFITENSHVRNGLPQFVEAAFTREAGRPYTVSEFNQPWPNTYAAEADPTLAAFASFQDWDGLMHFAYSHGRGWDDGVPNGFNLNGDWSKFVNFGQSAYLFRTRAVSPGGDPVTIPISLASRLQATARRVNGRISSYLAASLDVSPNLPFTRRIRIARDEAEAPASIKGSLEPPFVSSTSELTYDRAAGVFTVQSPRAAGVFGHLASGRAEAGPLTVELGPSARRFAAILVTPVDRMALAESRNLLISIPGHALRSQPGVTPGRPQRLVNYPGQTARFTLEPQDTRPSGNLNGGIQPVWMERVEAFVTLNLPAARITVYPLSGIGEREAALASEFVTRVDSGWRIHLQAAGQAYTPWYEIVVEE